MFAKRTGEGGGDADRVVATSFDELLDEISGANDLIERNRGRFGRISSPVLIIWGTEDRVLPATGGPRLAEAIPGAELHEAG